MRKCLWLVVFNLIAVSLAAQSFEISGLKDAYKGLIGETIKVPLHIHNTSDKPLTLVIRKVHAQIGGTQKNYFCADNNCLDHRVEDYTLKIDAFQTLSFLQVALDAGLAADHSAIRYVAFNKANPGENFEFELNFQVEESPNKLDIYSSRHITLHDVYPNPVSEHAFVDYKVLDEKIKAKIVIHNLLGNSIEEYALPSNENRVKIRADDMSAGIYFYTLYINNEGVVTRKLIIKK
ncbi:T9SS type A sorting domain-containing protein [Fulvivirgaceae bacterium PWU4]|uniref:T9SS type A sorting domain-containing protein n=1 Tax=Chryseosolibacter histidini TaxID=2782349 RepID=A0AAP2GJ56_9BACT|nr:T9SS type A sorting domain-containing protein [Chryseosolibacter histidini]MBT1697986.1 T9SS type A sorting domain-containing protein [Chryseosolibacter histidini]